MGHITIEEARLIAQEVGERAEVPRFYRENESAVRLSESVYASDQTVARYRDYLAGQVDDFGHGLTHSRLVALDAGAIVAAELGGTDARTTDTIVIVQIAGLLHDICRKEPNHAERSADRTEEILGRDGMDSDCRAMIVNAIRNHEAFRDTVPIADSTGGLVSDALYDADKFRWGPDNFIVTLWDMLEFAGIEVGRMLTRYHKSLEGIRRIRETFRTQTGRRYGPEFIDIGLAVGDEIYSRLIERQGGGS